MAIRSGFFNSVNGDRKYDASRFAEYFASFIGNGVFPNPSDGLQVMANDDMTVTVKAGKCWINGYIMINDDDYILEIEPADGVLSRIDRVVARYDVVDREIRLEVKKGAFASNPVAPNLQRDADAYELALADVYVAAGAISITQANITDLRLNSELCGIVHGTVEQVDTTTLFVQYQAWYQQTTGQAETDIETIKQQFQDDINQFLQNWHDWFTNITGEKEEEFDTWFNEIKEILNESTAANLLNLIESHKAENATEAHGGISILNDNITVTVGDNGDFSTINEALNYLTTKYPAYKSGGNVKATIKLLSGFVMSEQVLVRGLNLGWIEIVGEDAETTIKRSALTINFTIDDYGFDSFPAFGVSKGGTLPIIGQLFVMDDSGNRANRHGIMAVDNSRASILTECGVQNAGSYGIYAIRSSIINAYGANASNAGTYGIYAFQSSIIAANGANASNAGSHGIYADKASTINANGANASGAGEHGLHALAVSFINAWGADASGAGGRGVFANQASIINAIAVNARKGEVDSAEDIYVNNGSIIKISSTGDNQTIGGTNQDINTLTRNGIIFG